MAKVIVLGGGVAGLSAAHELAERGFDVDVYEAKSILGGKARSVSVPGTGKNGLPDLPGEHGFRFFPGFYRHVTNTMERIPLPGGGNVLDNLVGTEVMALRRVGKSPLEVPIKCPASLEDAVIDLIDVVRDWDGTGIGFGERCFFLERLLQIMTSCQERRNTKYEAQGWWDFVQAAQKSEAYQHMFGIGITRSLVAAKAELASTKTIGDIGVQILFGNEPGANSCDRVLNGPTNQVWINPWLAYLRGFGVRYYEETAVTGIDLSGGRVTSVTFDHHGEQSQVSGDYYIAALPVEVMAGLLTPSLLTADPSLVNVQTLANNVAWMNGIQFYLTSSIQLERGHGLFVDSQWALTSIAQHEFWSSDHDPTGYGDGTVRSILSVDVSEWEKPGINGKSAKDCTAKEIADEVWEELKQSINVDGAEILNNQDRHSWFMDPDIVEFGPTAATVNKEPLLVNKINSWALRPDAKTAIENLFLASDYVQTNTDLACMEGANEAARRAVNYILSAAGTPGPKCDIWQLHEPDILAPARDADSVRFQQGLDWQMPGLDFDWMHIIRPLL